MNRWIDHDHEVPIAVKETGLHDRSGLPLLWVHGLAHHGQVWNNVIARTQLDHPMLQMDLRGHGDSGWSIHGRYQVNDHASDILRVLDGLEIEKAIIVAHSLGGHAAILATALGPDRVEALALVDTGPALNMHGLEQVTEGIAGALRSYESLAAFRSTLDIQYPLAPESALDQLATHSLVQRIDGRFEPRLDPGLLATGLTPQAMHRLEQDLWMGLSNIKAPTLIVRGAHSSLLPADTVQRMREQISGATQSITIEGAGHSIMLDAAEPLARALVSFVRLHQPSTRAKCSETAESQAARFSSWG